MRSIRLAGFLGSFFALLALSGLGAPAHETLAQDATPSGTPTATPAVTSTPEPSPTPTVAMQIIACGLVTGLMLPSDPYGAGLIVVNGQTIILPPTMTLGLASMPAGSTAVVTGTIDSNGVLTSGTVIPGDCAPTPVGTATASPSSTGIPVSMTPASAAPTADIAESASTPAITATPTSTPPIPPANPLPFGPSAFLVAPAAGTGCCFTITVTNDSSQAGAARVRIESNDLVSGDYWDYWFPQTGLIPPGGSVQRSISVGSASSSSISVIQTTTSACTPATCVDY